MSSPARLPKPRRQPFAPSPRPSSTPGRLLQLALFRLPPALRQAAQARIACLVIPHFPLELELLDRPELRGQPVVIGGGPDQPKTVLDCSPQAERWGISIGLSLRQALARCHESVFVEAHPALYADVSDRMFRAAYDLSPRVEVREPGCLYVDVGGLRLAEEEILQKLATAVFEASGLQPRAAIASGKFPAYAAAVTADLPAVETVLPPYHQNGLEKHPLPPQRERLGEGISSPTSASSSGNRGCPHSTLSRCGGRGKLIDRDFKPVGSHEFQTRRPHTTPGFETRPYNRIIPADEVAGFVAELSCEHLPVPLEVRQRLRLFGLRQLRDIAKLPKSALLAQFSRAGARMWELSIGLDTEFLRAELPAQQLVERLRPDDPISSIEALVAGIRTLLNRLATRLRASAQAARSLRLRAELSSSHTWERQVNFKVPVADESRMLEAARSVIERTEWQSCVEQIEVLLTGLTQATGTQPDLFSIERHGAEQRIDAAIRQLNGRYRRLPLYRVVEADPESRIPERRFALASYLPESQKAQFLPLGRPRAIQVKPGSDGIPLQVFHSKRWQDVTVIREEFRLKDEWWSSAIARRYFRVVLANGRYAVIFSERGSWWLAE